MLHGLKNSTLCRREWNGIVLVHISAFYKTKVHDCVFLREKKNRSLFWRMQGGNRSLSKGKMERVGGSAVAQVVNKTLWSKHSSSRLINYVTHTYMIFLYMHRNENENETMEMRYFPGTDALPTNERIVCLYSTKLNLLRDLVMTGSRRGSCRTPCSGRRPPARRGRRRAPGRGSRTPSSRSPSAAAAGVSRCAARRTGTGAPER